ncbi:MAG: hypothetical protein EPO08_04810 [Rhodospirillaceae bacterium]|nr:MAG: hypothetical protein EPO08_04810 [Rhodospirillaceae bacterium]
MSDVENELLPGGRDQGVGSAYLGPLAQGLLTDKTRNTGRKGGRFEQYALASRIEIGPFDAVIDKLLKIADALEVITRQL